MWFQKESKPWAVPDLGEIRKRSRLVAIDDQDFPYEPLFKRDGYTLEVWREVENLHHLETGYYDLILLDLQGVGIEESADHGLGIIRHVKAVNPTQLIIAYSAGDFSLKHQQFIKLADSTLEKGDDYFRFKEMVDKLLRKRFSKDFYLGKILELTAGSPYQIGQLPAQADKALSTGKVEALDKYLATHLPSKETVGRIMAVVNAGVALYRMYNG
jgi:hypothetical protein